MQVIKQLFGRNVRFEGKKFSTHDNQSGDDMIVLVLEQYCPDLLQCKRGEKLDRKVRSKIATNLRYLRAGFLALKSNRRT
ncbi:MAG: hypothetical protein AVDCRST_MAG96-3617 [uncultured Segetibacter sp.]|uniref:Uncharacterized protein n=1 Tax=uncultured Segetibacter sp. TaxID=481133 RepID=A0A6J4TUE1_9BACT|nr:MAG: hypothetical protein AVDCRST_MAG96-3617 [uncultured Segetibacter sp.]